MACAWLLYQEKKYEFAANNKILQVSGLVFMAPQAMI
jgi:hypothetical protein